MASSSIAAAHADAKAARTRLPTTIPRLAAKRFWMPLKNAAACVASPARSVSHVRPFPLGLKKVAQLPPLSTTRVDLGPDESTATVLELDELWSFVCKKANDLWVWIALCRNTRQVVAYAVGDRSKRTCLRLWQAIPSASRAGQCFIDFWVTYQAVIPKKQHTAVGKDTGETAHVERWNNTLLQRLARFVRMTLSFSKSLVMHEACFLRFLHRYMQTKLSC